MKTLRLAGLLFACMLAGAIGPSIRDAAYSTWNALPPSQHDLYVQRHAFATRVDLALANPLACGNGSCGVSEPLTTSTTNPITFAADLSSGTGFLVNNAATGTLNSTTIPELRFSNTNTTSSATGCPDTLTGSTNKMFQIDNSANTGHAFFILCNGQMTTGAAVSVGPAAAGQLSAGSVVLSGGGGTSPILMSTNGGAIEAIGASGAGNAPALTWETLATSNLGAAAKNYCWQGSNTPGTELMCLLGGNGLTLDLGDYTNTAGNVVASAVTNGNGQLRSGGGATVTGAKGIGAVVMNGMPYSGTFCSVANGTTSNNAPTSTLTTLTTGQWNCPITSGSATATIFNISMPGAVTLTNPAACDFTTAAASAVEPKVTSSTSLCILTYAVAPGAVLLGTLMMFGNGP